MLCVAATQQLPPRDDPLYDLQAYLQPTPYTLIRAPRSADELLGQRSNDTRAEAQIARWKLGDAPALPSNALFIQAELQGFLYPERSDWRAPTGAYRVVGVWTVSEQALLELVLSDARRRDSSAFDTVPYARLTFQTGEWRWQVGYANLRWLGGYSGGMLVNDESPPVPHAGVQFPLRIPLLGKWQFEQFLSAFEQDGQTTWWSARRIERDFGNRWTLSLAEAFKALELPGAAASQIAPYYLYQKWYSDARRGSGWFNYLAEVGVVYKPDAQQRYYLFWLMDDLRAPNALGGSSITPRKVAVLVGARLHPAPNTRLILELVRSDGTRTGGVYDSSGHEPRYAYFYKGLPMGHPVGANRIALYTRAEHENGRWLLAADYASLRRFHQYRPGVRGYTLELLVGYQIAERSLLCVRYRASSLRDSGAPDTRAGWYLQAITQF